ncbi:MAG: hypothetical protein EOP01_07835, partial [Propionibacteriaceae bacterium]
MGNRPKAPRAAPRVPARSSRGQGRRPRRGRVVALLVLAAVVFALLRGLHALAPVPTQTDVFTEHVVLVGVAGRFQLTDADRTVLAAHLDDVQAGVVSTRPRYTGACAAAGWTTLGAGRRAAVGPSPSDDRLCSPEVAPEGAGARVVDWDARLAAAAASRGDARLGTLAATSTGCVAAVGPGAALAAARPDGTVAAYATPD